MNDDNDLDDIYTPDVLVPMGLVDKSVMGRPRALVIDPDTLRRVMALGALQCTQEEAAAALGVGVSTFKRFIQNEAVRSAWDRGAANGKVSVKRKQFEMAHKIPQMSIWWGKQHLGQSDKSETTTTTVSVTPEERVKRIAELQKHVAPPQLPVIAQQKPTKDGGR